MLPSPSSGSPPSRAPFPALGTVISMQPTGAKNSHDPAAAALLSTGVYRANASRRCWWALTPPLHPYLCWDPSHRRYVSVALSSRLPALGFPQRCVLLKARTFLIPLSGGDSKDAIACPSSLFSSILLHLLSLENPGNRYKLHLIGNVGGHMQDLLVQIHHHSRHAFGAIPGGQMGIRMAADAVGGIRPVL